MKFFIGAIGNVLRSPKKFQNSLPRNRRNPARGVHRLAHLRPSRRPRGLPAAPHRRPHLQRLRLQPHDLPHSHHLPRAALHNLRVQNEKNSRKFQRSQIHRLHNVLNLHRLSRLNRHLLRHIKRLHNPVVESLHVPQHQRDRRARLPFRAKSLSRHLSTLQERSSSK